MSSSNLLLSNLFSSNSFHATRKNTTNNSSSHRINHNQINNRVRTSPVDDVNNQSEGKNVTDDDKEDHQINCKKIEAKATVKMNTSGDSEKHLAPETDETTPKETSQLHFECSNGNSNDNADDTTTIDDERSEEIIKRKKQSLTLPLLNVIGAESSQPNDDDATNAEEQISTPIVSDEIGVGGNKIKKIYESDDAFIQTIFAQTIKSTTATPTDDDPSYAFEDFHGRRISQQSKSESLPTDDTPVGKLDSTSDDSPDIKLLQDDVSPSAVAAADLEGASLEKIVKTSFFDKRVTEESENSDVLDDVLTSPIESEPAKMFTYFHQTIDDDESPPFVGTPETNVRASFSDEAAAPCLDELIDSMARNPIQTNNQPLTEIRTASDANAVHVITLTTQNIESVSMSSPSLTLTQPQSNACDDNGLGCDDDIDDALTNDFDEQQHVASDAADAISSYDEHTQIEQNNLLTSNNSSSHVSQFRQQKLFSYSFHFVNFTKFTLAQAAHKITPTFSAAKDFFFSFTHFPLDFFPFFFVFSFRRYCQRMSQSIFCY